MLIRIYEENNEMSRENKNPADLWVTVMETIYIWKSITRVKSI